MSDLDAPKYTFGLKGSSSLRPCYKCKNVCNKRREEIAGDDFFRDISCPHFHELALCTDAEIFEALDYLHSIRSGVEDYEKSLGLLRDEHTLWADSEHRAKLPPTSVFADPFHIL